MKFMKLILITIISFKCLFSQMEITIYNENKAFINETREIILNAMGEQYIFIENLPYKIYPASISLFSENIKFLLPVLLVLIVSFLGNSLTYKFPALDPSMCPPYPSDQCDCSIYQDDLDVAKNSENITSSVFSRFSLIASGGLDAFENTLFLRNYIKENGLTVFGQGMGLSNISLSYAADEATKQVKDGQVVFRNPGQVVSFNNLFANLLMSTGLIGFIWFMYILSSIIRDLLVRKDELSQYMMAHLLLILFMFFFQAEELSVFLGISLGLITSVGKRNDE